jgi:hypothetical protein
MVSPRRRQVLIAGLASLVAPAALAALPDAKEKLVLSGRILGTDGKPLVGATLAAGGAGGVSDADGRFLLITTARAYRGVTCDGHPVGLKRT